MEAIPSSPWGAVLKRMKCNCQKTNSFVPSAREVMVIPVIIPLLSILVCSAEGMHYGRDDSLGSSSQETQSIKRVLSSCCRKQPSKRNWKMT